MQTDQAFALLTNAAVFARLGDDVRSTVVQKLLDFAGITVPPPDPLANEGEVRETDDTPRTAVDVEFSPKSGERDGYIGLSRGMSTERMARYVSGGALPGKAVPAPVTDETLKRLKTGVERLARAKRALELFQKHAFEGPWHISAKVRPAGEGDRYVPLDDWSDDGVSGIIDLAFQPHFRAARLTAHGLLRDECLAAEADLRALWKSIAA